MRSRASWGWIVLVGALAAPAFIFYQRWKSVNKDKAREVSSKVKKRLADEELFPSGSGAQKLTNPISGGETSGEGGSPDVPGAGGPGRADVPDALSNDVGVRPLGKGVGARPAEAPESQTAVALSTPPTPAPAPAAPVAPDAPQAPPGAVEAGSGMTPPAGGATAQAALPASAALSRDPMLSPYDHYMLEQRELQRMLREQEIQGTVEKARPRKREISIDRTIVLQGIISTPDGAGMAIVNGETVIEGGKIGPVSVVRITPQSVVFVYKNKKFIKHLSK